MSDNSGERASILAEVEGGQKMKVGSHLSSPPLLVTNFESKWPFSKPELYLQKQFQLSRKKKKKKKNQLVLVASGALWTHHLLVCILKSGQRRVAFTDFPWYKSFNDQKNSLFLNYCDSLDPPLESCGYHLIWESMNFSPIQVLPVLIH